MLITMDGKWQYRNCDPATVLKVDLMNSCPVISTDGRRVFYHNKNGDYFEGDATRGRHESDDLHPLDLVPAPKSPKYVQFAYADWKQFIGKVVVCKNGHDVRLLHYANNKYASDILYHSLFSDYTFDDGSVAGKLA